MSDWWEIGFIIVGILLIYVTLDYCINKTREGLVTEAMLKRELRDLEMRLREQNTETPEGQEKTL